MIPSFRKEIGFGFTLERMDSLLRVNPNLVPKKMVLPMSAKDSTIMHIK